MAEIIKRAGHREPFSVDKVRNSLAASSDEAKQPLNDSDLEGIISDFCRIIEGKTSITTQEVKVIVTGLLYLSGYRGVLDQYLGYKKG